MGMELSMISINRLQNKVIEIYLTNNVKIENPFWDIEIKAIFCHKEQQINQTVTGFYNGIDENGEHSWIIRWRPITAGAWSCKLESNSWLEGFEDEVELEIAEVELNNKGILKVDNTKDWKFYFENGEPFFLLGDTMYNLFGAYSCGIDVKSILQKRKQQGVNYLRVRMQNSSFHSPVYSSWINKDCWPWGGTAQWPDFKSFNLNYFKAVDDVMQIASELEIGLEVIFEAWMLEFPFNDRARFIPEYEELWFQYIIARYSAYPCVYIWCPANEYEFYPEGTAKYHSEADRFMKRMTKFIRENDPYKHPIGVHNWGEETSPLTNRMSNVRDLEVYLVQTAWVKELYKPGADIELCAHLEEQIQQLVPIQDRATMLSEFGYELTDGQSTVDAHELLNHHHTRRGQWRAGFAGYPVVHGFNNTWGPHMNIATDSRGADYLIHYARFMTGDIKFYEMKPNRNILIKLSGEKGETQPVCLSNRDGSVVAIYYPVQGECELNLTGPFNEYSYYWYNPCNGAKTEPESCSGQCFVTPEADRRKDWVLVIKRLETSRNI